MPFLVCRHIKTNGLQCGSPAMRGEPFCYFHERFRRRTRPARCDRPSQTTQVAEVMQPVLDRDGNFSVEPRYEHPHEQQPGTAITNTPIDLGLLEDAESVQVAISAVVNALAGNRLQRQRATALLYGLQLAAQNCRALPARRPRCERMLREAVEHEGETLAKPGLKNDERWVYDFPEDAAEYPDEDEEECAEAATTAEVRAS